MNRNLRHTMLFSLMGTLALCGAAWGQGDGMFQRMDGNNDGRISAQEHAAGVQAMFVRMDANKDGAITADEMTSGHGWRHGGDDADDHGMHDMMSRMDANHDGEITAAEHAAAASAMFARMDANHDGRINAAEMQAGHGQAMGGHDMAGMKMGAGDKGGMAGMKMGAGDKGGMAGMKMGADDKGDMPMRARMHAHMQAMDANHDGRITSAELAAGAQAMFTRMDANHDGYLTKAEMQAGHAMDKPR
ncbi:EF-hand domain-containing protein [Cognatiluteimonas profundi]|uniref:EF-hand domain-containing protein n=1 Tax=Cognatiluteimonas profundi TaxID=2594501 RepID=UPI00131E0D57|nr:EF-hand domain-containing protein [Lysobacter profundi]